MDDTPWYLWLLPVERLTLETFLPSEKITYNLRANTYDNMHYLQAARIDLLKGRPLFGHIGDGTFRVKRGTAPGEKAYASRIFFRPVAHGRIDGTKVRLLLMLPLPAFALLFLTVYLAIMFFISGVTAGYYLSGAIAIYWLFAFAYFKTEAKRCVLLLERLIDAPVSGRPRIVFLFSALAPILQRFSGTQQKKN